MLSINEQANFADDRTEVAISRAVREPFGKDTAGMDQAAALWFIGRQLERIADVMEEAHK